MVRAATTDALEHFCFGQHFLHVRVEQDEDRRKNFGRGERNRLNFGRGLFVSIMDDGRHDDVLGHSVGRVFRDDLLHRREHAFRIDRRRARATSIRQR